MRNLLIFIFMFLSFHIKGNAQNAAIFSGDGVKLLKNKLKFKDTNGAIRFESGGLETTVDGGTTWTPLGGGGVSSSSLQLVDADGDSTADFFTDDAFFIKLLNESGFTFKVDGLLTTLKNVLKIDTTNNFLPLINPILTNTLGGEDQVETYLKFEHKMDPSATPTVGFGAAQSVWLENSVDLLEHASKIETKWTDVTNTGEDAVMTFSVFTNGIPDPVDHIKLENNELHLLSRAGVEGKVVFHEQGTNGTDTLTISAPTLVQSKAYTLPNQEPAALVPQSLLAVTPTGVMSWVDPASLGTNTDADAIHDNVSGEILAIATKTALEGNDLVLIEDSAATFSKKGTSLENIKLFTLDSLIDGQVLDPAPDPANDTVLTWDSDASSFKKVLIQDLSGGANDPTRINDGDNDTFVDTDLSTNTINMGANQIVMGVINRNAVYDGLDFTLYGLAGDPIDRGSLVLVEPDLNGANRISLKAPLFVDNDYKIWLPQNEGVAGQFLSAEAVVTDGLTQAVRLGWTNPFELVDDDGDTYVRVLQDQSDEIEMQVGGIQGFLNFNNDYFWVGVPDKSSVIFGSGDNQVKISEPADPDEKGFLSLQKIYPLLGSDPRSDTDVMALRLYGPWNDGNNYIDLEAPDNLAATYTIKLPTTAPVDNRVLKSTGTEGQLVWGAGSSVSVQNVTAFPNSSNDVLATDVELISFGNGLYAQGSNAVIDVRLDLDDYPTQTDPNFISPSHKILTDTGVGSQLINLSDIPNLGKPSIYEDGVLVTQYADALDFKNGIIASDATVADTPYIYIDHNLDLIASDGTDSNGSLSIYDGSGNGNNKVTIGVVDDVIADQTIIFGGDTPFDNQSMVINSDGTVRYEYGAFQVGCDMEERLDNNVSGQIGVGDGNTAAEYDVRRFSSKVGNCSFITEGTKTANTDYVQDEYWESFILPFGIYRITCETDVWNQSGTNSLYMNYGLFAVNFNQFSTTCQTVQRLYAGERKKVGFDCHFSTNSNIELDLRATTISNTTYRYGEASAAFFNGTSLIGNQFHKCTIMRSWFWY